MIVPNIIGDIGGAEKTNFYTHYHTLYFPFLVYAFLVGFSEFIRYKIKYEKLGRAIVVAALFVIIILYNGVGILPNQKISFDIKNKNSFLFVFNSIRRTQVSWEYVQNILKNNLPKSSSVSTVEAGMAYLYKYRNLSFYPLNINSSDYIFVIKGADIYNGYFGYNGIESQGRANNCLNKIIDLNYYTDKTIHLTPDYVLLKNLHKNK